MLKRALVLCLIALASSAGTAGAGNRGVGGCHVAVDFNLVVSSARNMTCRAAGRELRRYKKSISRRFRTPRGFVCTRVSGGTLGGQWRCVRGGQAFRFEFSD
jgi:hypothetical protein